MKRYSKLISIILLAVFIVTSCNNPFLSNLFSCKHEWSEFRQTIEPTCTEAGIKTRTCIKCSVPYTTTMPGDAPLGHLLAGADSSANAVAYAATNAVANAPNAGDKTNVVTINTDFFDISDSQVINTNSVAVADNAFSISTRSNLNFPISMEITSPRVVDTTKTIISLSYGNVKVGADYEYPDIKPDANNKVDVNLQIRGKITCGEDVLVDISKWDIFDKKAKAVLTLIAKGLKIEYNNNHGISFLKSENNKEVLFTFDQLWSVTTDAEALITDGVFSLACDFCLPLRYEGAPLEIPFRIVSVDSGGYYYSENNDTVFVPIIQIFSDQIYQNTPAHLINPVSKTNIININYGNPEIEGDSNYTYETNKPSHHIDTLYCLRCEEPVEVSSNFVSLFAPLDFSLEIDRLNYPNSVFKEFITDPVIQLDIAGIKINYNRSKEDIKSFFSISENGSKLLFNMNPDWNLLIDPEKLNNAGEASLIFDFAVICKSTENDGSVSEYTINVNSGNLLVKPVLFNSQTVP
ncbi:MAG: hypothetical protein FWD13_11860 [Treponema sp.]|nr:hypothetical protein [Treponema sp.]